jgi:hypothetical protein
MVRRERGSYAETWGKLMTFERSALNWLGGGEDQDHAIEDDVVADEQKTIDLYFVGANQTSNFYNLFVLFSTNSTSFYLLYPSNIIISYLSPQLITSIPSN